MQRASDSGTPVTYPRTHCALRYLAPAYILHYYEGMDFRAWITDLIGGDTLRTASEKIGLAHSTITRQLSRDTLTPQAVIALCRAYDRKPVDGLVETGYLQPWEIEGVGVEAALDKATNKQLLGAVMRRSDPEATYLFGLDQEVINPNMDSDGNVLPFPPESTTAADPEQGTDEDTTPPVRTKGYDPLADVAYSGPDEDAQRRQEDGDFD